MLLSNYTIIHIILPFLSTKGCDFSDKGQHCPVLRGPQSLVTLVPLPGTDYDKWDTIISQEGLEVSKRLPVCWVLGLIRFYEHKQMEPKPPWMMFVLPGWVILMVVFD